jgi:hypothetical protein
MTRRARRTLAYLAALALLCPAARAADAPVVLKIADSLSVTHYMSTIETGSERSLTSRSESGGAVARVGRMAPPLCEHAGSHPRVAVSVRVSTLDKPLRPTPR